METATWSDFSQHGARLVRVPRLSWRQIPIRIVSVALAAAWSVAAPPTLAQNAPVAGAISGYVIASVSSPAGSRQIPFGNVTMTLFASNGDTALSTTTTDLNGRFATPLLAAGTYRVCASSIGFARACNDRVRITKDSVSLRELLMLRPLEHVLQGHISLRDGSLAIRFAGTTATTAGAAEVSSNKAIGRFPGR